MGGAETPGSIGEETDAAASALGSEGVEITSAASGSVGDMESAELLEDDDASNAGGAIDCSTTIEAIIPGAASETAGTGRSSGSRTEKLSSDDSCTATAPSLAAVGAAAVTSDDGRTDCRIGLSTENESFAAPWIPAALARAPASGSGIGAAMAEDAEGIREDNIGFATENSLPSRSFTAGAAEATTVAGALGNAEGTAVDNNIGFETEKSLAGSGTGGAAIKRVAAARAPGAGPRAVLEKYDATDAGGGADAAMAEGAAATGDSDCLKP